ncbi:MAG: hypothetical protein ACJ8F7_00830 [Gemmataceae bacterium]
MASREIRLNVERLEGRELPSTAPIQTVVYVPKAPGLWVKTYVVPTAPVAPTPPHVTPTQPPTQPPPVAKHALATAITGSYICTLRFGATNSGYHFQGTANIKGMGEVEVVAQIYGVGFGSGRGARGSITFTNDLGSVTVKLTGPVQPPLSPIPNQLHYVVTAATGKYVGLKDSGTVTLTRTPDKVPVKFGYRFFETGGFRMVLA